MKNKRTPDIRFPEFTGDWEERKLSELMEFSNGINAPKENYGKGRKMISVMDILADEPIVYRNIRNSVQVDDKTESKNKVENGDLVFVRSSEIPNEVGWAKAYRQEEYALYSGFSIRGKKKSDFDAKFIELSLNTSNREQIERKAGGSTRFNVSQSILKSIEILEPSIEEQIEIGNFFERLDDTIALHQQELTTLKQTKQGFLQKMFPKEGETLPEIRFPGFTGDWEQRKFENMLDENEGIRRGPFGSALKKEYFVNESDYVVYEQQNAIYNNYETRYNITKEKFDELKKFKLEEGDFIMSGAGTIGRISRVPKGIKQGVFNQALIRFKIDTNLTDSEYFLQLIRSENMQRKLTGANPGSAITNLVPMSEVKKWDVVVPSLKEQTKIGNFLKQLDDTIALHQRELDALKETKKAFLQKMFA